MGFISVVVRGGVIAVVVVVFIVIVVTIIVLLKYTTLSINNLSIRNPAHIPLFTRQNGQQMQF